VSLGDVAQSRFRGADDTPDGVLASERPRRPHLPYAHFVSLCPNLKKRLRVDSQASANVDRDGYLALLRDTVDHHVRKYYSTYDKVQTVLLRKEARGQDTRQVRSARREWMGDLGGGDRRSSRKLRRVALRFRLTSNPGLGRRIAGSTSPALFLGGTR